VLSLCCREPRGRTPCTLSVHEKRRRSVRLRLGEGGGGISSSTLLLLSYFAACLQKMEGVILLRWGSIELNNRRIFFNLAGARVIRRRLVGSQRWDKMESTHKKKQAVVDVTGCSLRISASETILRYQGSHMDSARGSQAAKDMPAP
jgi:hypothetical protein